MSQKHILFITYENPFTRNSGDRIYTSQILESLGRHGCTIDLLLYDSNGIPEEGISEGIGVIKVIPFSPKQTWQYVLTWRSGSVTNRRSLIFTRAAKRFLGLHKYSTIFVNHTKMCFLIPALKRFLTKSEAETKICAITHNAESQLEFNTANQNSNLYWKAVRLFECLRAFACEKMYLKDADEITSICDDDFEYHKRSFGNQLHYIIRPVTYNESINGPDWSDRRSIVVCGSFAWKPKRDNLLEFLCGLNLKVIAANGYFVKVVGKMHPQDLGLFRQKFPSVIFTGQVHDVLPHVAEAAFNIIPEKQGGGFKLKILEAAANGAVLLCAKEAIRDSHLRSEGALLVYDSENEMNLKLEQYCLNEGAARKMIDKMYNLLRFFHSKPVMDVEIRRILG